MDKWEKIRVVGPLDVLRDGFGQWLAVRGYALDSIANLVRVLASLARWMSMNDLGVRDLTTDVVDQFAQYRRSLGYTAWCSSSGLSALVAYLREHGMPAEDAAPRLTGADALLRDFGDWLVDERHVGPVSVKRHMVWARQFVDRVLRGFGGEVAGHVGVDDVEAFMAFAATRWAAASMGGPAAATRLLLAYLSRVGLCDRCLVDAVPKTRRLTRLGLPTALTPEAVAAVLTGDDGSRARIRDTAVAALAADLGLRAAEIARLMLDDFDWVDSVVTVSGKNGLRAQMPLTSRAGDAVARWLSQARQQMTTRHVFHTVAAPLRPMTGPAVVRAVRAAGERVGVEGFTTRATRHRLGCAAVAGDGGLEDARQLLRHESAASTAIYARVDTAALAELAVPWPGVTL